MSLSREEIIRMAREAGLNVSEYTGGKLAGKLSIFDYADVDIFIEVERALNAAYAAGAAAEREQSQSEIKRLRQGLWDCYKAAGGDTDGDDTPDAIVTDIVEPVLACVTDLRECYNAALSETPEPVAKVCHDQENHIGWNPSANVGMMDEGTPLYTTPPNMAALSQSEPVRYVPMTEAEFDEISAQWTGEDGVKIYCWEKHIEREVIRRAGLEVQE